MRSISQFSTIKFLPLKNASLYILVSRQISRNSSSFTFLLSPSLAFLYDRWKYCQMKLRMMLLRKFDNLDRSSIWSMGAENYTATLPLSQLVSIDLAYQDSSLLKCDLWKKKSTFYIDTVKCLIVVKIKTYYQKKHNLSNNSKYNN